MRAEFGGPLKDENLFLRHRLQKAKAEIKNLKRNLKRFKTPELGRIELNLLRAVADLDLENAFAVTLAEDFQMSKAELDFHLMKLVSEKYIQILFTDCVLGENFQITQRGRQVLFNRKL